MALISFKLNENLYLRDPQSSDLGQNIISSSVKLMDSLGFEDFTFRKLAEAIGSTEASVYRYFENKHRLLLYLIDWYWSWLEHRLDMNMHNLKSPAEKLKACLTILCEEKKYDSAFAFVDEPALARITAAEFEKTYLTKQVDKDNKEGLFLPYKSFCHKIVEVIKEVNPTYSFPNALVSTVMLAANHQLYYAEHLPSLTDISMKKVKPHSQLQHFLESLVLNTISK